MNETSPAIVVLQAENLALKTENATLKQKVIKLESDNADLYSKIADLEEGIRRFKAKHNIPSSNSAPQITKVSFGG